MGFPVDDWLDGIPAFDWFDEEIPPPSGGIFDDPVVTVSISMAWRSHVLGALERLLWRGAWAGDDEQKDAAIKEVLELYAALAKAEEPVTDYTLITDYTQSSSGPIMPSGPIPSTYRDLEIIINARSEAAANNDGVLLQLSSETDATHYQSWLVKIFGNNAIQNVEFLQTVAGIRVSTVPGSASDTLARGIVKATIPDYAGNRPKYLTARGGHEQGNPINARVHTNGTGRYSKSIGGGNYDPVLAVTALLTTGGNWSPGSTMRIYGVGVIDQ